MPDVSGQCQRAKLWDPDGKAGDKFGFSVAMSSQYAAVAAPWNKLRGYYHQGVVFVYEATAAGWMQTGLLPDVDSGLPGGFGYAVSAAENRVGAGIKTSQEVYEFEHNGVIWTQQGPVLPPDWEFADLFGAAVALTGTTMVIGAPEDLSLSGSAYVFQRLFDGGWACEAKLLAADGLDVKLFGYAVAMDGDRVVIGAPYDDDQGMYSGSAYVFERGSDGTWSQKAKLLASDGGPMLGYAYSVAISGDVVLVCAADATGEVAYSGAVYAFERQASGTWIQTAKLYPAGVPVGYNFGDDVAMDGNLAVIGANGGGPYGGTAGALYVFVRHPDGSWSQAGKVTGADTAPADYFGKAVAISGNIAVVGAPYKDAAGPYSEDRGAAYIFAVGPDEDGDGVMDACETPGDLNCDGAIDAFDIDPFILALTDPVSYAWKYPTCGIINADCNGDGTVDAFDIDPFVALLIE